MGFSVTGTGAWVRIDLNFLAKDFLAKVVELIGELIEECIIPVFKPV